MWAMALLTLLLLTKQRRRCKRRMVNICMIIRFFFKWLRQLHTLHDPSTTLQRSFVTKTTFDDKTL
ncbi:hypothetical protein AtNW77_Chr5g0122431 [Arabidopsis thaliana]